MNDPDDLDLEDEPSDDEKRRMQEDAEYDMEWLREMEDR